MRNEMSRGEVVVYQRVRIGFDELLAEGVALLESDQQEERAEADPSLVEAESEMPDLESAEEDSVDSDLVEVGR